MTLIQNPVKDSHYKTDLMTMSQKTALILAVPKAKGFTYILLGTLALIFPYFVFLLLMVLPFIIFIRPTNEFPSRIPREAGNVIDRNDPGPGGKGFHKARGDVYLGVHRGTGKEAWAAWDDMLTHLYMLAATGGGKSEAIWAILANFYCCNSAYSLADGKGTLEMIQSGRTLARIFGIEDDYFVLNYISENKSLPHKFMSNTLNTWGQGTAAQLKEQLASLALSGNAGQNQFFEDNASVIIERIFPAFVELRDKGLMSLDIQTIGSNLSLTKMFELSNHPALSPIYKQYITDYLDTAGFDFNNPKKQNAEVVKMHGQFVTHFSKAISSLSIQYRNIYVVDQGDINQKDITSNRRTLISALPSLEKSGGELQNLGKIILTGQKNAISTDLGDQLEGTADETTMRLSKNHKVPYCLGFDEWAFYAIQDMALLPAQIRGIKYCGLYAAQDYKGTERAGEMDAEQVFANTRFKFFGALEEAGASWTRIRDLIGEFLVAINSNYKYLPGIFGGKQVIDREKTEITRRAPIEIKDLQQQVEGQFFMFQRGRLSPIQFYHTNLGGLGKEAADGNGFKINRLCRVYAPSDEEMKTISLHERFQETMYSSNILYSNIDSLALIKREITARAERSALSTSDYAQILSSYVDHNALRFGLKLNQFKPTKTSESTNTDAVNVALYPDQDSLDAFMDVPSEASQVTTTRMGFAPPESVTSGTDSSSAPTDSTLHNLGSHQIPEALPPADSVNLNPPHLPHFDELSEQTIASKMGILNEQVDFDGAHILSKREAHDLTMGLTTINSLLGFKEDVAKQLAVGTVENLHRHCYYLAPPKPPALESELIGELDTRIDELLN